MTTISKQIFKINSQLYNKHMTLYYDDSVPTKASILYFHGGGFLYGSREDLPELHLQTLTRAGYAVLAYDYPLAPAAKLPVIFEDVCDSIKDYVANAENYVGSDLPYFLWGRSAGAYLCLLAAGKGSFAKKPLGLISYYGYGLLCDSWFQTPSTYYKTLPPVPATCMSNLSSDIEASGPLDTHYMRYVYARQTGTWKESFFADRDKFLFLNYSLRLCDTFSCPLFCAHSTGDTDVPYEEFMELNRKYRPQVFIASTCVHDFDRMFEDATTQNLLDETLKFLEKNI